MRNIHKGDRTGRRAAANQVRPRRTRILVAALTALALSLALLGKPAHGRGAGGGTQPSSAVAVIPGFAPASYPGYYGIPPLPVSDPRLAAYHFSQLPAGQVATAALAPFDTLILYGIRWSDISASGQAAINAFARTHKVIIWDADDTGSQSYSTFLHPFSDTASGENGKSNSSVVSFPGGVDFLASDNPASPYYLDPNQLVSDRNMINDMSAMATGTANWVPALVAANKNIPQGGWPLAWSYGVISDQTGLTIYSGVDADAFSDQLTPNYAVKELALQLAAPFRETPDSSCGSGCQLPSSGKSRTYASCSFARPVPTHWVHGRVVVTVDTSVAAGITARVTTRQGRQLVSGRERSGGVIRLAVQTRRLPSNRIAQLRAVVFVNRRQACTNPFVLRVDNKPPRLLTLATTRSSRGHLLRLRVSEVSSMSIVGSHVPHRPAVLIAARRTIDVRLPARVTVARLILRDRAGNTVVRRLAW